MADEKTLIDEVSSEAYDAQEKPFDFIEEGRETALICESDPGIKSRISDALKENGYLVTEPASAYEALKYMRFHVYRLVIINEKFDTGDSGRNSVIEYLENLSMNVRRRIFVVLISGEFRTMDNMAAFGKSVNLVLNPENIGDAGAIIKHAIMDNESFYQVFRESSIKAGRL